MDNFAQSWTNLKEEIAKKKILSEKSVMWENLIKDFPATLSHEECERNLFKSGERRGYNFLEKGEESIASKMAKIRLSFTFLGSAFFKKLA